MAQWELIETAPSERLLKLSGDWNVEKAEDLHKAFLHAMRDANRLQVDMGEVGAVDLTFFQVVHSALKSCKDTALEAVNIPSALARKAEMMGFSPRHISDTFWKGAVHVQTHHDRG